MNADETPKILIVDDRPENLLAMGLHFEDEPCTIVKASSGNEALSKILVHEFAVVLLDVQMPGMDGFETAELMRSNKKTANIPIIFVTAISKEKQHLFKGYEAGAVDYIFKPLEPVILKSKVAVFLSLYNQKQRLQKTNARLHQAKKAVEKANLKFLEQQKIIMQEERLKVLLNMAGATAHELSQPLTILLGNIELIDLCRDEPEEISGLLDNIKMAGERISKVVRRIQNIRHYDVKSLNSTSAIVNIDQTINILCIEDSDDDFFHLKQILSDRKEICLLHAKSLKDAHALLGQESQNRIDLIFLDLILNDGTGLDFLNNALEQGLQIPVVAITGQGNKEISAKLIQAGACEYLPKSKMNSRSLSRIIFNALEKAQLRRDLKRMQARLVETSTRDELTGLYNRRYLIEALENEIERAHRYDEDLSLLIVDIDHFKKVNDTHGHPSGDLVLSAIAKIFLTCVRQSDFVGRLGGEEFAVLLTQTGLKKAVVAGEKIRKTVEAAQFSDKTVSIRVTVSIGVSAYRNSLKPEAMISEADKALYLAKQNGRNQVRA